MDQSWHEMNQRLASIRQEYRTINQELTITRDYQRGIQLRAWASTCVADYLEVLRQYRATASVFHR